MKIVLLSGGKGKRLWPLSTDSIPKQFIPLFNDNFSMLTKTYNSILQYNNTDNIYIATGRGYKNEVLNQINGFNNFIIEPAYIGTFGAILNIAVYLSEIKKVSKDEIISVVPIDHDVDKEFYKILTLVEEKMKKTKNNICLVGIKPTFPSIHYGYILSSNNHVISFKEKPDIETATKLIANGALWNSGIINFRLEKIIEIAKKNLDYSSYDQFLNNYNLLPHQSFEYEVLEKEKNLLIVSSDSYWDDLGTWDRLSTKISNPDEFNTNIINFEDKKIINEGIENAIIINTINGLKLVSKNNNNKIFRQWGYYEVLNSFDNDFIHIIIKKIMILDNRNIGYQYHNYSSKELFILSGSGEMVINGKYSKINTGDVIKITKSVRYSIRSIDTLEIIEVQYGDKKIDEEDVVRLEYDWNTILKSHMI